MLWWVVSQRCVISAGPSMFASSNVVRPSISTLGEIFQPAPRSAAQAAPVPSMARPPPPFVPSKFSGLIERDWALLNRASERRSVTAVEGLAVVRHSVGGAVFPVRGAVLVVFRRLIG